MRTRLIPLILIIASCLLILSCSNSGRLSKEDKKIFISFFKTEPPADVRNFHYFPDILDTDTSYWISFECNESSFDKITETLNLRQEEQPQENVLTGLNIEPRAWWDTAFIKKASPYSFQKENMYRYLWYDKAKKKVYFLSFDT